MKIVHITSVHPRFDVRIFEKECISLGKNDMDISLVVADGKGNELKNGVQIYDIGNRFKKNRFLRIIFCPFLVMLKGLKIKGDIFHFHDPELLIAGVVLKIFFRKKVIYDVHEDVPLDILSKFYLPIFIRKFLSISIGALEKICSKKFDGIILAVPYFQQRFSQYNSNCLVINNYPVINNERPNKLNFQQRNAICYVGAITKIRGIKEVIIACYLAQVKLILAGNIQDNYFENELRSMKEWD